MPDSKVDELKMMVAKANMHVETTNDPNRGKKRKGKLQKGHQNYRTTVEDIVT